MKSAPRLAIGVLVLGCLSIAMWSLPIGGGSAAPEPTSTTGIAAAVAQTRMTTAVLDASSGGVATPTESGTASPRGAVAGRVPLGMPKAAVAEDPMAQTGSKVSESGARLIPRSGELMESGGRVIPRSGEPMESGGRFIPRSGDHLTTPPPDRIPADVIK
jgi:hypothetical protein